MSGLLSMLDNPGAQLGLGLLAAAGPSPVPMSFGQRAAGAIGQFQASQRAEREAKAAEAIRELQAQMLKAQMLERQQAMTERQQAQARQQTDSGILRNLAQGIPADGMGPPTGRASLDPQAFLAAGGSLEGLDPLVRLNSVLNPAPKADELMTVAPGATVLNRRTGQSVFTAPKEEKDDRPADFRLYELSGARDRGLTFDQWDQSRRRAGATSVNVSTGQRDANWGTPPKDTVWARDQQGNVLTERDPATGAFRPVAVPVGGSAVAREDASNRRQAAQTAQRAFTTLDQMLKHPGLNTAIGLSGQVDPRNVIWGTEAQGARALIEQAQGQAFLQAFESLKGGGQITQVEGDKATQAIARLQRAQNERDFRAAAEELKQIANDAHRRATGQPLGAGPQAQPAEAGWSITPIGR